MAETNEHGHRTCLHGEENACSHKKWCESSIFADVDVDVD